jgi:hypothetical protein
MQAHADLPPATLVANGPAREARMPNKIAGFSPCRVPHPRRAFAFATRVGRHDADITATAKMFGPDYHPKNFLSASTHPSISSIVTAYPNLKWPSPCAPNADPGIVAICAFSSRICAAVMLFLCTFSTFGNA